MHFLVGVSNNPHRVDAISPYFIIGLLGNGGQTLTLTLTLTEILTLPLLLSELCRS